LNRIVRIAIVGGICTGKSTVADVFALSGLPVISGDEVGHQVLENSSIIKNIISRFGNSMITNDGKIDRTKLSNIVFSNRDKLRILNEIIKPQITIRIVRKLRELKNLGEKAVVVDAALIYEWGTEKLYDIIIMTIAPNERRLRWIMERFNIDRANAHRRLEIHRDIEGRILLSERLPDYIISNDGNMSLLREKAKNISGEVKILSELYSKGLVKDIGRAQDKGLQRKVREYPRS